MTSNIEFLKLCMYVSIVLAPIIDVSINSKTSLRSGFVGYPYVLQCLVYAEGINSSIVGVRWTGPNGNITNDGRLNITSTVSNGTNHTSTLQFPYLSEDDEGLYECRVEMNILGINKSELIKLENFTSELNSYKNLNKCMHIHVTCSHLLLHYWILLFTNTFYSL